ncbi:putative fe/-s oxidoreductase [Caudoviricetes sp.]|nr:putative fe/-s oxidoreductase [Caudoviricetes sp.]
MKDPFSENKILAHLDRLAQYVHGEEYPPILVEIDLTNKCTSDCPWCFGYVNRKWSDAVLLADDTDDVKTKYESSAKNIYKLLSELIACGVKAITWTGGGDPTCHKGLIDFLRFTAGKGIKNGLITNGVISVEDALPYCEWIRFSVDGASEEVYGTQHGKPQHFKIVVNNITEIAKKKVAENHRTTLGVAFVTHAQTKAEIVDFAKMWKDVSGIDYIQYRPLLNKYGEQWFSDTVETIEFIRQAKEEDGRVTYSEPKYKALMEGATGQTDKCHGIFFESAIAADSKVYTCCHMKGKESYAIGDLNKESFTSIWKRHLQNREFKVNKDCPSFCRHYGTNKFIEENIMAERQHANFI